MKFLLAFLLFSLSAGTIFSQLEERGYKHEFDLGFAIGTSFKLNFNPIDHSNTNGIFPSPDSLDKMTFHSYKNYQPLNVQFSYTKWFQNRRDPTGIQFGVKGQIATGYTVSVSESWKSFRQWTYDTVVSQTGEKFPRDSIREDEFSLWFSGHTVNVDLGFRMLIPIKERFEFVAGLDFGTAWFRKQEVRYQYTKIEDVSETTDEEGNVQRFSRNITEQRDYTKEYQVNHSIYQLSMPLELRFVRSYRRNDILTTFKLGDLLETLRFSLQVTPTIISVHTNGARTTGFSAVFGLGIAFCI